MKITRQQLLLLVLGALIVVYFLLPGDEDRIRERLEQIRELAEVSAPEAALQQALVAKEIAELAIVPLTLDLNNINLGLVRIDDHQQLAQGILKLRSSLNLLELKVHDPRVSIVDGRAEVELLGSALGQLRKSGLRFLEIHRVVVTLQKTDGVWLVTGARHIRNEQAPPPD